MTITIREAAREVIFRRRQVALLVLELGYADDPRLASLRPATIAEVAAGPDRVASFGATVDRELTDEEIDSVLAQYDAPPAHVHECTKHDDDDHSMCRCKCGALAFNSTGESEWTLPK